MTAAATAPAAVYTATTATSFSVVPSIKLISPERPLQTGESQHEKRE